MRALLPSARPLALPSLALAALLVAGACGSGDSLAAGNDPVSVSASNPGDLATLDPAVDTTIALPDGWYEMAGYGTVLAVDGDEVTPHYVTASTCVVGEPFDNALPVDHADDDGVITLDLVGPTTDYRLLPLTEAPMCESTSDAALTALDELFSTHYPFFAERGVDWPAVVASLEADANDPDDFEAALGAALVDIGDGHTMVEGFEVDPDLSAFGEPGIESIDDLGELVGAEFDRTIDRIDGATADATGSVAWGELEPGVGYLIIVAFEGISGEDDPVADREALRAALDEAIADLDRYDRLVVDLRFNGGGYEDLAVLAAGYFVDETTPAYRKWAHAEPDPVVQVVEVEPQAIVCHGEIVVLTSPMTASAAEAFLLAITEVTDAIVVGGPSFGEFSDAIDWTLPDGTELTLSMETYTTLDGENYEAVGVPVDVPASLTSTVDVALETLAGS